MTIESNFKKYGTKPYSTVLVHGGPGAAGSLAELARGLSSEYGIVEALQTKDSINGQIDELQDIIIQNAHFPVILIGHSWGAWLVSLYAAKFPNYCKLLILIACPPFDCKFENEISKTRLERMSQKTINQYDKWSKILNNKMEGDKNIAFTKIGNLLTRIDSFSEKIDTPDEIHCNYQIFSRIWPHASKLRKSGHLLIQLKKIRCPITFIHGQYDPHPCHGITEPLDKQKIKYELHCIPECGHYPWLEIAIKNQFLLILKKEIDCLVPSVK
jgi:pimeloyl-ACP methyl ester carboxylesterase